MKIFGISLIVVGLAIMLYLGVWICIIDNVLRFIDEAMTVTGVAISMVKIILAPIIIDLSESIFMTPGWEIYKSNK